jgi:hypothetical protein
LLLLRKKAQTFQSCQLLRTVRSSVHHFASPPGGGQVYRGKGCSQKLRSEQQQKLRLEQQQAFELQKLRSEQQQRLRHEQQQAFGLQTSTAGPGEAACCFILKLSLLSLGKEI